MPVFEASITVVLFPRCHFTSHSVRSASCRAFEQLLGTRRVRVADGAEAGCNCNKLVGLASPTVVRHDSHANRNSPINLVILVGSFVLQRVDQPGSQQNIQPVNQSGGGSARLHSTLPMVVEPNHIQSISFYCSRFTPIPLQSTPFQFNRF